MEHLAGDPTRGVGADPRAVTMRAIIAATRRGKLAVGLLALVACDPAARLESRSTGSVLSGEPMPTSTSDVTALADQLQQDAARGVPPFGAASVRRARELGSAATPMLRDRIAERGPDLLLALEALRGADPAGYDVMPAPERAAAYVAALAASTYFNAWGQAGRSLTDTSRALIALGPDAVKALTPLLDDLRAAPSSGSQDATLSQMNGNRVCDYAWVLINEVHGTEYAYAPSPADRDREIAATRATLPAP